MENIQIVFTVILVVIVIVGIVSLVLKMTGGVK